MENTGRLDGWEKQEKLCDGLYYYRRDMQRTDFCVYKYHAHIFISLFENEDDLKGNWEFISNLIAVRVQTKVRELIEKSNFYLCFFVEGEVSDYTRELIEGDSFSAKKYIFKLEGKTLEDFCIQIEHRIFSLAVEKKNIKNRRLNEIELQNFRAYEGKVKVRFQDTQGKAASLVAIYAKNGVGKTSLFDGVEYALKGEIGRLGGLKDKRGAIYHNIQHASEKAYVKMIFNDGKIVHRNVAKIQKNGNDCRNNPPIEGKELVGDPKQWDQTILPHDKIDTFISAKNPMDRYKQWIESAGFLKNMSEEFEEAHKQVKKNKAEENAAHEKVKESCQKINSLEKQKESIENWQGLIEVYNANAQKKLIISEVQTSESYDKVINQAFQYKREIQEVELKTLQKQIDTGEEVLQSGVEECLKKIKLIKEQVKELEKKERSVERKRIYEKLCTVIERKNRTLNEEQQELILMQKIGKIGIEKVHEEKQKLEERENQIKYFQERISAVKEEKLKDTIRKKKENILGIEKKIQKEESEHQLKIAREEFEKINGQLEEEDGKLKESQRKIEEDNSAKIRFEHELSIIQNIFLPEKLENLYTNRISYLSKILSDDSKEELLELESKYKEVIKERENYQKQLKEMEKDQKELASLCNWGRRYINDHHELTSCPLCHTSFGKWEILFQKVNFVQVQNQLLTENKSEEIGNEISRLLEQYDSIKEKFLLCKEKRKKGKNAFIKYYEEKLQKEQEELLKGQKRRRELEYQYHNLQNVLAREKIPLTGTVEEAFNIWIQELKERLYTERKELKKSEDQKIEIENNRDRLELLLKEQGKVLGDIDLYQGIQYLKQKPVNFSLEAEQQNLCKRLQGIQEEILALKKEKDHYEDVSEGNLEDYIQERKWQQELLEENKEWEKKCLIFKTLTKEAITTEVNLWKKTKERLINDVELLQQICEENGAREFFSTYKRYKELAEKQKQALEECRKKCLEAEDIYKDKKRNLEGELKDYFSQTLLNIIFQKIDPHQTMKNIDYDVSFNDKDVPELTINVSKSKEGESYRPEWYFSSAQLTTVAFSSFFGRALQAENLTLGTIFIDDPIEHYDDLNILSFADLLRSVLEFCDNQIIISTHDEKIFQILERKFNSNYYSSCFIRLPEDCQVIQQ